MSGSQFNGTGRSFTVGAYRNKQQESLANHAAAERST